MYLTVHLYVSRKYIMQVFFALLINVSNILISRCNIDLDIELSVYVIILLNENKLILNVPKMLRQSPFSWCLVSL